MMKLIDPPANAQTYKEPDRFKCCICQRIFYGIEDANRHRKWADVNGLVHTVVPITKCIFCHGCDST